MFRKLPRIYVFLLRLVQFLPKFYLIPFLGSFRHILDIFYHPSTIFILHPYHFHSTPYHFPQIFDRPYHFEKITFLNGIALKIYNDRSDIRVSYHKMWFPSQFIEFYTYFYYKFIIKFIQYFLVHFPNFHFQLSQPPDVVETSLNHH